MNVVCENHFQTLLKQFCSLPHEQWLPVFLDKRGKREQEIWMLDDKLRLHMYVADEKIKLSWTSCVKV